MENMENYLKKIENKYILQEIISQTKHSKIYLVIQLINQKNQ